jgi:ABC-type Na+ efflux pump permease subunit
MAENTLLQDQLKNLKKRKEILIILLFLFVIVIFWIGLSLFSSQQKLGITPEQKKLSQPLTPNIDVTTLEKIEKKKKYTDYELQNFPIYVNYESNGVIRKIDVSDGYPDEEEEELVKVPVSTEEAKVVNKIDDIVGNDEE